jgi:ABC-type cobalamin/Fe3+-siderophores transport system ATPase subunit
MPFLYLATKDSWEQARLMGYISAQTHSTKKMSVSDIVSFPWEESAKAHDTSMSNADKRRLEEKAKQLEQMMNQNERKG